MALSRQFRRRVARDLEMFTNQPFARPVPLGDIGVIRAHGQFDTAADTTLVEKGVTLGAPLVGQPFSISWQSSDDQSFEVSLKAAGEKLPGSVITDAKAGLRVKFGRRGNYLFEAADAVIERVADTAMVHAAIAKARKEKKLRANDRIVMAVLKAQNARILMSETTDAEVEFEASASFRSIIEGGVEFVRRRQKGSVADIQIRGNEPTVLFMTIVRVRLGGAITGVAPLHVRAKELPVDDMPVIVEPISPWMEDGDLMDEQLDVSEGLLQQPVMPSMLR